VFGGSSPARRFPGSPRWQRGPDGKSDAKRRPHSPYGDFQ
jgi:hypothetical protein